MKIRHAILFAAMLSGCGGEPCNCKEATCLDASDLDSGNAFIPDTSSPKQDSSIYKEEGQDARIVQDAKVDSGVSVVDASSVDSSSVDAGLDGDLDASADAGKPCNPIGTWNLVFGKTPPTCIENPKFASIITISDTEVLYDDNLKESAPVTFDMENCKASFVLTFTKEHWSGAICVTTGETTLRFSGDKATGIIKWSETENGKPMDYLTSTQATSGNRLL